MARSIFGSITADIDFYSRNRAIPDPFRAEILRIDFFTLYQNQILSPSFQKITRWNSKISTLKSQSPVLRSLILVLRAKRPPPHSPTPGVFWFRQTEINFFKPNGGLINLKADGSKPRANAILAPISSLRTSKWRFQTISWIAIFRRSLRLSSPT